MNIGFFKLISIRIWILLDQLILDIKIIIDPIKWIRSH